MLDELAYINPVRSLLKRCSARCFDMATLPTKGCVPSEGEVKPYNGGMRFTNGDTIMARITPCLENGKAAYINLLNDGEIAFGSTEYIVLSPKPPMPNSFFYFLVRNATFVTFAIKHMNGSSGRQRVSGTDIAAFGFSRPSNKDLQTFDRLGIQTLEKIKSNTLEAALLERTQTAMMTQLSSGK